MPKIPLIGVSDSGRTPDINSHRAVNLMPMVSNTGAKEIFYWVSSPGLTALATTDAVVRGMHEWNGVGYFVADTKLYSVTTAGVVAELATGIAASTTPVVFAHNDWQLAFVQGDSHIYVWDGTNFDDITAWSEELSVSGIVQVGGSGTTFRATCTTALPTGIVDNTTPVIFSGTTSFNRQYIITSHNDGNKTIDFVHLNDTDADETGLLNAIAHIRTEALTIAPTHIAFMDTYGVVNNTTNAADRSILNYDGFVSKPSDFRIWQSATTFSAEREPDALVAITAFQGDLWLLGAKSIETYYNAATGNQPFSPTRPSALQWGCAAPYSVCQAGEGLMFLGTRTNGKPVVMQTKGYSVAAVSSKALEYQLGEMTPAKLLAATAFSYRDEGGDFYCLTFDTQTWVYDASTTAIGSIPMWHERQDYEGNKARAKFYAFVGNSHLVSDHTDSTIYEMDRNVYQEDGQNVTRFGVSGSISNSAAGTVHNAVIIDMEHPVGSGDISLSWSDDGGNTFSTPVSKSFTGRNTRVEFFGLGYVRSNRVYKISIAANLPVNINTAWAEAEPCKW